MTNSTDGAAPLTTAEDRSVRSGLSPISALLLAIWLGLCAGYLDLGFIVLKKHTLNKEGSYRTARDFPWTVPAGHVVLSLAPGIALAAVNWRRSKRGVSLRVAAILLATLALWGAFLRLPIHGAASLFLAFGVGLIFGDVVTTFGFSPRLRWVRTSLVALCALLVVLAASSTGRRWVQERRAVAALPLSNSDARNVVFIVLDTVRASRLSLYGYSRETTPNLARWAKKGVVYNRSLAPAPWTFPSHATFFTGQWPSKINSQWKYALDTPDPTLAEFLSAKGYQTTGFAANTNCCNYETGLDRGFLHFEDYALTARSLLSRTVPGRWILERLLSVVNPYERKWVNLQSRGAKAINRAFLGWLDQRRTDRPFFAFVNYFDAHEPYIPPPGEAHFGIGPKTMKDYQFLVDFIGLNKSTFTQRDLHFVSDSYDNCVTYLDSQIGQLLDELERKKLLENTVVVITSDHGEAFGEHGTCGHSYSVNMEEVGVPLLILAPEAPVPQIVYAPVSLRDLSATVMGLLGFARESPFPGQSLTAYWNLPSGEEPAGLTSPVFSEQASEAVFETRPETERGKGFAMSLVALGGFQYIRSGRGAEQLYDLWNDPLAQINLVDAPDSAKMLSRFRGMLLKTLIDNPPSAEVERAYMKTFRQELSALVHAPSGRLATSQKGDGGDY